MDQGIVSALHRELVWRTDEGQVRKFRNFGSGRVAESRSCIDARSYGGAAQREAVHTLQGILDAFEIVAKHPRITRPLLAERDRGGILHMGATYFDDVF